MTAQPSPVHEDVTPAQRSREGARLLTADELAQRWQVPKSWVYAATRDERIPAVRLGRYYRYRVAAIEAFEREGGAAPDA